MGRNCLTSQNLHDVMSQYAQSVNGHRNICRIIDYEVSEKSRGRAQQNPNQTNLLAGFNERANQNDMKVENNVYVISESYNLSLFDLYCTSQAEKTNLSEEFLLETSFQVLKALEHLSRQSNQRSFRGFNGGFKGMLRM